MDGNGIRIRFNHTDKTATITKKLDRSSRSFDSDEYKIISRLRKDYPSYRITYRQTNKNKQTHKGLTFDFMEMYISAQPDKERERLFAEYNAIQRDYKAREEKQNRKEAERGLDNTEHNKKIFMLRRYTQTKAWFVKTFKKYYNTPEYQLIIDSMREEEKDNESPPQEPIKIIKDTVKPQQMPSTANKDDESKLPQEPSDTSKDDDKPQATPTTANKDIKKKQS